MKVLAKRCIQALKQGGGIANLDQLDLIAGYEISPHSGDELPILEIFDKIEQDFQEGRTVEVDGWVLAESEVYYYIACSSR